MYVVKEQPFLFQWSGEGGWERNDGSKAYSSFGSCLCKYVLFVCYIVSPVVPFINIGGLAFYG